MAVHIFTPSRPPKSGSCKKLWDWWRKHRPRAPDSVTSTGAGREQRSAGACSFIIHDQGVDYLVFDVQDTIKLKPDDALRHPRLDSTYSF